MSILTFGAELELADWSRSIKIPSNLGVIDVNDNTVANSDGVCVNPYTLDGKGGEICTVPCTSPKHLSEVCEQIYNLLDEVSINHTCWLHIHVGIPEFYAVNLKFLKRINRYITTNSYLIRDYTSICPVKEGLGMTPDIRKRRNLTRITILSHNLYRYIQSSRSVEEFWERFSNKKRCLVNIQPLKYQNTIEFRCFYATLSPIIIRSVAEFCRDFVLGALDYHRMNVLELIYKNSYQFPDAIPYDQNIENIYRSTYVNKQLKVDNFTGKPWGVR